MFASQLPVLRRAFRRIQRQMSNAKLLERGAASSAVRVGMLLAAVGALGGSSAAQIVGASISNGNTHLEHCDIYQVWQHSAAEPTGVGTNHVQLAYKECTYADGDSFFGTLVTDWTESSALDVDVQVGTGGCVAQTWTLQVVGLRAGVVKVAHDGIGSGSARLSAISGDMLGSDWNVSLATGGFSTSQVYEADNGGSGTSSVTQPVGDLVGGTLTGTGPATVRLNFAWNVKLDPKTVFGSGDLADECMVLLGTSPASCSSWFESGYSAADQAAHGFFVDLVVTYDCPTLNPILLVPDPAVCAGATTTLSVLSVPPCAQVKWFKDGAQLSGAASANYAISSMTAQHAGQYYAIVESPECGTHTTATKSLALASAPSFQSAPPNTLVCRDDPVTWTVSAAGTAPVTYEWKYGGFTMAGPSPNATSYFIANANNSISGNWSVVASNECGSVAHNFTLTINDAPFIGSGQPQSASVCAGQSASFSVTAGGSFPMTYQWFKNGALMPGKVANPLTLVSATAADSADYTCLVSNWCGSDLSHFATLTVSSPPAITTQPAASQTLCAGGQAKFIVEATSTIPATYRWWKLGVGPLADGGSYHGTGTPVLQVYPLSGADSGTYKCVATNACGPIETSLAVLDCKVPPSIVAQPQSINSCVGSTAVLSCGVQGAGASTFQWYRYDQPIPGATGTSLVIPNVTVGDAALYHLEISDPASQAACGTIVSAAAGINVVGVPTDVWATDGDGTSSVGLSWAGAFGAQGYRVYRADDASGMGLTALGAWQPAESFVDSTAIPGHSYYYSVASSPAASGIPPCGLSPADEGWRALTPPVLSAAYVFPQAYVTLNWTSAVGAGYYRVYRRLPGDPSSAVPVSEWNSATTCKVAGEAFQTYEFWVCAAIDAAGTHASAASNLVAQTMPCAQPGQECGATTGPGLLVLLDHSVHMAAPSFSGTRWSDAVLSARANITGFFNVCPSGSVAIWTFDGQCVNDLTVGFVGEAQAGIVLDSLPASASSLGAPVAQAMCQAIDALCICIDTSGGTTCQVPTINGPKDKILLALTAAVNDFTGLSLCDSATNAVSGSNCSTDPFLPGNSWQKKICNKLSGICPTVYAQVWQLPLDAPTGAQSMAAFAQKTGGQYQAMLDGAPLAQPFFNDCNGNGIADALDIQSGVSQDCDQDGRPDECEDGSDCNDNQSPDGCDLAAVTSYDQNQDGLPDECQGFHISDPALPLADLYHDIHVVGGAPSGFAVYVAGFASGNLIVPLAECAGVSLGIIDFFSYGFPLVWVRFTDAHGHSRLQVDIPAGLTNVTTYFQALEITPTCRATNLISVTWN